MSGGVAPTRIRPDLIEAYRATEYQVRTPRVRVHLRVDEPNAELAELQAVHQAACSAFLTAHNPASQRHNEDANHLAQVRLEAGLHAAGFRYFPGLAVDPAGIWPAEPSVLILGMHRPEAVALGHEFGQNAILWMAGDAIPRLVLLR